VSRMNAFAVSTATTTAPATRKKAQIRAALLAIVVGSTLSGCLGARAQTSRSFALTAPTGAVKAQAIGAPVVRVRDLDPSPVVDRDVLVMRRGAVEVTLHDDLRWAERPHRMVSNMLARILVDGGWASAAPRDLGHGRPTLEIEGRLDTFEHDVSGGGSVARVALVLSVRGFDDGLQRGHYRFASEQRCANDPAAAVVALSALTERGLREALEAMAATGAFAPSANARATAPTP
jgi:ABC-type uncharacterized transport system auxiliary subunit